MHDAAAGKNKIVRARRARAACAPGQRSYIQPYPDIMQLTDPYSCNYSSSSKVHNDASHDGHRERRLTAAHSILAGAVAPHQDAQEAFGIGATRHGAETRCL
jgi:hypothetical protein